MPAESGVKLRTNLPQPLPALRGREEDLLALGALMDQHQLVSVIGAGGIGKTLLVQHLLFARRATYAHGVCSVDSAPQTRRSFPRRSPPRLASIWVPVSH